MRTGKRLAGAVVAAGVSLLVVSACGGGGGSDNSKSVSTSFADCTTKPNDCNGGKTKQGGTLTYTIEKKITGWNLLDADSNTFDFQEVLDGVLPSAFNTSPDFSTPVNTDMMASIEQTSTNPQTIVYKIRKEAVWNDGTPITADDFIYNWQTQNGKDCKDCSAATNAGYDQMKSVTASDDGKTVTVVYNTPYADWKAPFGPIYPAHLAKQHGDLATSWKWFNETQPSYSGGPYQISEYQKDVSVTLVPNPKWYGKTKASLDKLVFRIITDQAQEVPALQNNEVQAIYPQPNQDIVNQVKALAPNVQYTLGKGLTWEHLDLNLKNKFLADKALRQAIFTAVNRQSMIDKTVGQFTPGLKPLNNHNFMPGIDGYKDVISSTDAGNGDVEKAKKLLTDAGYKGVGTALTTPTGEPVTLRISYTTGNSLRKASAELFQGDMQKALGLKVEITPTQALGKTLTAGDYDAIIFAWVDTPFPYSGAQQLWASDSSSNYGKWVNPQSDALLKQAASEPDSKKAAEILNQADQLLANDFYVLPLFQKPTFLAVYSQYANIRDNPTNVGPPYNTQEWGLRATAK
jgi:peptide/nickel transport system substrate-binding protein